MKKRAHIICILDRSGSMKPLQDEVINSFNNFVEKQKETGKAFLTLVLFDDEYSLVFDKVKLETMKPIDESIYFARGMTSLYDAIGKTLNKYSAEDKALVLIQTDGAENSSKEFKKADIKKLIEEKEKNNWEFVFLGANIDASSEGLSIGLSSEKTVQFAASANGIRDAYASMSATSDIYKSKISGSTFPNS